jgi:UDP-3-O-[3-hydroxymyristoyl] glucosamine N-acyltransferase
VIDFLSSKNIEAVFTGNKEQLVTGLSHLDSPQDNTIFYSENKTIDFNKGLMISNVKHGHNTITTNNPKLAFYYLSEMFYKNRIISSGFDRHNGCIMGSNTVIGNCKIGKNVIIGHNTVIEDDVTIGDNVVIGNNCSIGCFGLSWTWNNKEKVFLYAVGKTIIGNDCKISSNVKIVRGVFSKSTVLGDGVMIAPGSAVGHGATIGDNVHIANNCSIGGSAVVSENCFLGSSATVSTYTFVGKNTILAASSCTKSNQLLDEDCVYLGVPAKKHKKIEDSYSLKGVPKK